MAAMKFPKFYRFITESPFLSVVFLSVFLVVFILVGFDLLGNVANMERVLSERRSIALQIQYWHNVVGKYKDYRDGYFQLAVLEYRLGNMRKAKMYLKEVFRIDPNFEKARVLERLVNERQ